MGRAIYRGQRSLPTDLLEKRNSTESEGLMIGTMHHGPEVSCCSVPQNWECVAYLAMSPNKQLVCPASSRLLAGASPLVATGKPPDAPRSRPPRGDAKQPPVKGMAKQGLARWRFTRPKSGKPCAHPLSPLWGLGVLWAVGCGWWPWWGLWSTDGPPRRSMV